MPEAPGQNVRSACRPSQLRISDLHIANVLMYGRSPTTIVRLDTNQGFCGYGGVRDGGDGKFSASGEPLGGR